MNPGVNMSHVPGRRAVKCRGLPPPQPGRRVWRRDEIARISEFCARHGLVLVSDDIHCDLMLEPGAVHEPFCVVSPAGAARTVTLMAPSKTFNTPGLGTSFAIIPEPALRALFAKASAGIVAEVNALGSKKATSSPQACSIPKFRAAL